MSNVVKFPLTWQQKVSALAKELGRKPTLQELLDLSKGHTMSPAERQAQCESWVRGMTARCEHGELDFEQCAKCRGWE